ncbi:MAG: T9SS type A sorting domain-containing protein [Candidatus Delongbacteria bacterium]|nr:T9SS type A sorting domain-containing protein [Candidatus Delongbacteria bacterium]MBN2834527.1 T9SS type A sorting domain-containing protein [Candidatus Delongbacteria bacterium]
MNLKKLVMLFLLLVAGLCSLMAGNGFDVNYKKNISGSSLEYSIDGHKLSTVTIDGQTYTTIDFEGKVSTNKKGFAELPYIHASVQLENNKDVDVKVTGGDYEEFVLEYPLLPSRGVIYRNEDPNTIPYTIAPESVKNEFYPGNLTSSNDPFIYRDVRGVNVYAYPFQYNAATKTLRVYNTLNVALVENASSTNPLSSKSTKILKEMDSAYRSVFVNYDSKDLTIGEYGDIHVIHTSRDSDVIAPYIEWKKEKGYNVTSEIVSTGTNVKNTIQAAYAANPNIMYVQLVGDWADIKCDLGGGANAPMDPMLGCVVGNDNYPDIVIGRFSASTTAHVTAQVDKTIAYEKDNNTSGDWYKKGLGIASTEGPGDDGETDNAHMDVIKNDKLLPYGYNEVAAQYGGSASASGVGNIVNAGVSIINYVGHGSHDSWVTSGFSTSNAASLTNGTKLPFVVSVACVNGEFHTGSDCFAEGWSRNANGGSIAFAGSTINQPWQPPMRGEDYFNDIVIGGYDYSQHAGQNGINTDESRITYGSAFFNALVLMYTEASQSEDLETIQTWTIFGDASVNMRTDVPAEVSLSSNTILAGVPYSVTLTAGGSAVADAMIAISQGDLVFKGITDASGNVTVNHELVPGNAKMVVTGKNLATVYEDIVIASPDQPWDVVESFQVSDDNNNEPDYGETVKLDITLKNVGSVVSNDITAVLSSESEYVTINDSEFSLATLAGNTTSTVEDAFEVTIAGNVTDQMSIPFTVTITDNYSKATYTSNISFNVNAPALEYVMTPSNAMPDPGNTVNYTYAITNNGHAAANSLSADLDVTPSNYSTIVDGNEDLGNLAVGATANAEFTVTYSESTPTATIFNFSVTVTGDLGINVMLEDEVMVGDPVILSNNFSTFPGDGWETLGGGNWGAGTGSNAGGTAPEAEFNWNPSTVGDQYLVTPALNTAGLEKIRVQFTHSVSYYGPGYELLLVTSTDKQNWHVVEEFENGANVPATAIDIEVENEDIGSSTVYVAWMFSGDSYQINQWYVDDVTILKVAPVGINDSILPTETALHQNYPNPFNPETTIKFDLASQANITLAVYNTKGEMVQRVLAGDMKAGVHTVNFNAANLSSGVYYYRLNAGNQIITRKMILVK